MLRHLSGRHQADNLILIRALKLKVTNTGLRCRHLPWFARTDKADFSSFPISRYFVHQGFPDRRGTQLHGLDYQFASPKE